MKTSQTLEQVVHSYILSARTGILASDLCRMVSKDFQQPLFQKEIDKAVKILQDEGEVITTNGLIFPARETVAIPDRMASGSESRRSPMLIAPEMSREEFFYSIRKLCQKEFSLEIEIISILKALKAEELDSLKRKFASLPRGERSQVLFKPVITRKVQGIALIKSMMRKMMKYQASKELVIPELAAYFHDYFPNLNIETLQKIIVTDVVPCFPDRQFLKNRKADRPTVPRNQASESTSTPINQPIFLPEPERPALADPEILDEAEQEPASPAASLIPELETEAVPQSEPVIQSVILLPEPEPLQAEATPEQVPETTSPPLLRPDIQINPERLAEARRIIPHGRSRLNLLENFLIDCPAVRPPDFKQRRGWEGRPAYEMHEVFGLYKSRLSAMQALQPDDFMELIAPFLDEAGELQGVLRFHSHSARVPLPKMKDSIGRSGWLEVMQTDGTCPWEPDRHEPILWLLSYFTDGEMVPHSVINSVSLLAVELQPPGPRPQIPHLPELRANASQAFIELRYWDYWSDKLNGLWESKADNGAGIDLELAEDRLIEAMESNRPLAGASRWVLRLPFEIG